MPEGSMGHEAQIDMAINEAGKYNNDNSRSNNMDLSQYKTALLAIPEGKTLKGRIGKKVYCNEGMGGNGQWKNIRFTLIATSDNGNKSYFSVVAWNNDDESFADKYMGMQTGTLIALLGWEKVGKEYNGKTPVETTVTSLLILDDSVVPDVPPPAPTPQGVDLDDNTDEPFL